MNILVTGGSGTLGQTIVRLDNGRNRFTIYSRSELLQAQMRQRYPDCRYVLGDVRDYDRLSAAVAGHDLVIHAAAMKRIPECEANPPECYATNVAGSANVIRACNAAGVARCIGISTDKACRAITTYGASKLLMESLFQAAPGPCAFHLVRYGNVMSSRGSVIPLWRKQAADGKPLTITHPDMTRFFMTPAEAVQLVWDGLDIEPGQVLVRKMHAVNVLDMARWIAPDTETVTTGLRSNEKLHEDLIHPDESAREWENFYLVGPSGHIGNRYTSADAPRFNRTQFLSMLAEVEAYE